MKGNENTIIGTDPRKVREIDQRKKKKKTKSLFVAQTSALHISWKTIAAYVFAFFFKYDNNLKKLSLN